MPRPGKQKYPPVSWAELPNKFQLVLMVMARFSEPLTMSSIRSYMYYQLKWFDPTLSDAAISSQAGYITSAFMFAQFLSAFLWGKAADSEYLGRKKVLMIGLMGTAISTLGFGFSTTYTQAMFFRILGGMLNGNVGVMRTMVSEMIKDKKYQSRAFMLMPMTGNIGQAIGPMLGGFLADPVNSYPSLFGPGTFLGGENGVSWMIKWPYLLPNLANAVFIFVSACSVVFGVEETHYMLRDQKDWGIEFGKMIKNRVFGQKDSVQYARIPADDSPYSPFVDNVELQDTPVSSPIRDTPKPPSPKNQKKKRMQQLPFRRIFTRNVVLTFLSRGLLAMHIGAFGNLWYMFLSTPRADNSHSPSTILFTGGLGLSPARIGVILSIIAAIGIVLQLLVYPPLTERYGTTICYRLSLILFPVAYFVAPFIVLLPSSTPMPKPASGWMIWGGMLGVLFIHVLARTFAMPASTILVNNCCPHPSVLSTVHGVSQSVSSGFRMMGPVLGGWGYAIALSINFVALPFWVSMVLSGLACILSLALYEGDGHEIKLPGDEELEDDVPEKETRASGDAEIGNTMGQSAQAQTGSGVRSS